MPSKPPTPQARPPPVPRDSTDQQPNYQGEVMRYSKTTGTIAVAAMAAAAVTIPTAAFADTPVPAGAATATASHAAPPGPVHYAGLWMAGKGGNWWVGSDKATENGHTVITDCVIPGAALLTPTSVRNGYYGSRRESAELGYVMLNWGTSPSGSVAAGARLAMLKIVGRPIPGLKVPAKIATYARNDLLNAERYAGPDKASVTFGGRPATPGQSSGVKMDIISASGHSIPGVPVRFTAVSASVAASGRSGDWLAFTRTSPSAVRVSGTATVASAEVTIGTAPHGQTLIGALPARVTATAAYQAHPAPVRSSVRCNCDGTAGITGTVSQAAGADEGRYVLYVNGKPAASVTIPAGRHAQSAALKATASDGAVVAFAVSYKQAGRWTAPVALGGTFTVHCPVMPAFTVKCGCANGTSTAVVTIANPSASYTDTVTYSVDGGPEHTVTVPAGATRSATVPAGSAGGSYQWSWKATLA